MHPDAFCANCIWSILCQTRLDYQAQCLQKQPVLEEKRWLDMRVVKIEPTLWMCGDTYSQIPLGHGHENWTNNLSIGIVCPLINSGSRNKLKQVEADNPINLGWLYPSAMLQDEIGSLTIKLLFFNFSDIDVIEWHEFLTPQLKLSQLFKAKPKGDVSCLFMNSLPESGSESDGNFIVTVINCSGRSCLWKPNSTKPRLNYTIFHNLSFD